MSEGLSTKTMTAREKVRFLEGELTRAKAERETLRAERDEARDWVRRMHRETQTAGDIDEEEVKETVYEQAKRIVREAEAEAAAMRAERDRLRASRDAAVGQLEETKHNLDFAKAPATFTAGGGEVPREIGGRIHALAAQRDVAVGELAKVRADMLRERLKVCNRGDYCQTPSPGFEEMHGDGCPARRWTGLGRSPATPPPATEGRTCNHFPGQESCMWCRPATDEPTGERYNCAACGKPYPLTEEANRFRYTGGEHLCWTRDDRCLLALKALNEAGIDSSSPRPPRR